MGAFMKLLVLDGNSILNRAFYGIKLLTTKEGVFTNAVFGFLTTLIKLKDETNPDAVAIAFDLRAPTFRHEMFDGYKANRKGMPPELAAQMPVLKEILVKLGYTLVTKEGFEADDILGTFAKHCGETDNDCMIATGDKDSLQLVDEHTTVRLATTKLGKPEVTLYTTQKVLEDFGVLPEELIDIKAIQGDSSDNIPGVAGIGQKGAADLISEYKNIEYIYENIDTLPIKEGTRQKLKDSRDMAFLSKKLGTIVCDVPVNLNLEDYRQKEPEPDLKEALVKLELFSIVDKLCPGDSDIVPKTKEAKKEFKVKNIDGLNMDKLEKIIFYTEIENNEIKCICVVHENTVYTAQNPGLKLIDSLLNNEKEKITHNAKEVYKALIANGAIMNNLSFDCMLAAYILNPSANGYDLDRLMTEYGTDFSDDLEGNVKKAAAIDELYKILLKKINQNNQYSLLSEIEQPLALVLASMESYGFLLDQNGIKEYGQVLSKRIEELTEGIYESVGKTFNINSPKQLGEILFEDLGLRGSKKTKTGYSTNAEVLEGLIDEHECVAMILEYRTLSKLNSTYVDGLIKSVSKSGRIHTSFIQTEARTGRLSSVEPNLQNIPVRTELGRELRKFFIAKDGCVLVDADYSQIELRVLAHMSKDKNMIKAFNDDADIHSITAAEVFNLPPLMVTPLMRSRAKAVNFGIVYGIGAFSLSKDIGVSRKEAENYIEGYLNLYYGVKKFMDECKSDASECGYAKTMFERRRYLPELASSNHNMRAFGERVAMNMPIQGTAADIIKIAMIKVFNRLKSENLESRLILQVHDELIVEAPENEAEQASKIIREEMQAAAQLSVELSADVSVGKTWYQAKG